MSKHLFILASLLTVSSWLSPAGAQRVLTLDDCRRLAAGQNASVRVASEQTRAATEVSREAFTNYFPQINATWLGYTANKGALQYTLPNLDEFLPQLGSIPLGTIELLKNGWAGSVTALQPVFMGGRIVNGNKLAHVGEAVARLREENAVDQALLTAEDYYWKIATLQSKRRTLTEVLQLIDTLESQVNVAVKAGVSMRNDLLKVQLRRNELRADMVDLDNGITLMSNLLAQYVGLDGERVEIASEQTPEEVPAYPMDIYMEPQTALPATVDYRLLDRSVQAADLRHRMAVGENLPEVAAGAAWVYDDLLSQKHNFGALMLTVNVPISGWWGGSHKIKQASIEAETARIQREDLSQMLQIKMQNCWDDLTSAYRKMQIAHESIGQSSENLRLNRNYYDAGVCTITDLLEAQTLFRRSLDQYTDAYGDYRLRRAQYLTATGRSSLPE